MLPFTAEKVQSAKKMGAFLGFMLNLGHGNYGST